MVSHGGMFALLLLKVKTLIPVAWSCGADIVVFFCTGV